MRRASPRAQGGFTLIETIIVVGLSFWITINFAKLFKLVTDHEATANNGRVVALYNAAVASYVTNEPARLGDLTPPQPFPFGAHAGLGWLQAPPCPGATGAVNYLPCGFNPTPPFGLTFNTNVAQNGVFIRATTNFGPAVTGIGVDRAMGGAIIRAAEAHMGSYTANIERVNGFTSYDIDPPTGNLFAFVDTSVLGVPFLKVDGSNQMQGGLNMGNNSINRANNIQANGNVTAGNTVFAANVAATASVSAGQDVTAGQDMAAGRNVSANNAGGGGDIFIVNTRYTNPLTTFTNNISLSGATFGMTYVGNASNQVRKPLCPVGKTAQIFMVPGQWSINGISEPIGSIDLRYTDLVQFWTVYFFVTTPSHPTGYVPPSGSATALVATTCQ